MRLIRTFVHAVVMAFMLAGGSVAAAAGDVTFTGEVTYHERMALPPNAELWVTLVALTDGRAIAGDAATIAGKAQPPLQFTLNVRSSALRPDGQYGLLAEIRANGRTLFRAGKPVAVDASTPSPTLIVVSFSPEPAPVVPDPPAPLDDAHVALLDITWLVTSIGGRPVLPHTNVTLTIAADLGTGGHGGCNSYFTEADFTDAALAFGPVAGTLMGCADEVMAQEAGFFAALEATAGYELAGDTLRLLDAAGVPLVGLIRAP